MKTERFGLVVVVLNLVVGCGSRVPLDDSNGEAPDLKTRLKALTTYTRTSTQTATGNTLTKTATAGNLLVSGTSVGTVTDRNDWVPARSYIWTTTLTRAETSPTTFTKSATASGTYADSGVTYSGSGTTTSTMQFSSIATSTATKTVAAYYSGAVSKTLTAIGTGTGWNGSITWTYTKTATGTHVSTVTETITETLTNSDTATATATATATSTETGTSADAGTDRDAGVGACLQDWRNSVCGHWCTRELQIDRKACELFLECYRTTGTGPTNNPAGACGVNKFPYGAMPKFIADQVYQCLACPGSSPATSCNNPLLPDTTPCTDSNACTSGDRCQSGACLSGAARQCPATDECHGEGSCDRLTGACGAYPVKANGTRCSDGNPCTVDDACQIGACRPGPEKSCDAPDDCHGEGTCDPSNGVCGSYPEKADGTTCSDGNPCTMSDSCQGGACSAGAWNPCPAIDDCHEAGHCDPTTGQCPNLPMPDGTTCTDGNHCTANDTCLGGNCHGDAVKCAPADQCNDEGQCEATTGTCLPAVPRLDGTPCNDGITCTTQDACTGGACSGLSDCPTPDQCQETGICSAARNTCDYLPKLDGTPCDDSDPSTNGEACQRGTCMLAEKWSISIVDTNPIPPTLYWIDARDPSNPSTILQSKMATRIITPLWTAVFGFPPGVEPLFSVSAYGGRATAKNCQTTSSPSGGAAEHACVIELGRPVRIAVTEDGSRVTGRMVVAWEVSESHITTPSQDGANNPVALTDAAGEAVLLVKPNRTYSFSTMPAPGQAPLFHFSRHTCPETTCDCDRSRCKVTSSGSECQAGQIEINNFDPADPAHAVQPALPFARDVGTPNGGNVGVLTSNRFMVAAAQMLLRLAGNTNPAIFNQSVRTAFGDDIPQASIDQLRAEIMAHNFTHALPEVQIVEHEWLKDHLGAFSKDTSRVYISASATSEVARAMVYQMEVGHFIARFLRQGLSGEAPGSEADIFYLSATGVDLSLDGLMHLRSESDHGTMKLHDGTTISVRYSIWSSFTGAVSFVVDGISELATGAYSVASTIWKGLNVPRIPGYIYSTTYGAGKKILDTAVDLTGDALYRLNTIVNAGGLGWANEWVTRLSMGTISTSRLTMAYETLATVVDESTESMKRVHDAVVRIQNLEFEEGVRDLVLANVQFVEGVGSDLLIGMNANLLCMTDDYFFAGPARPLTSEELKAVKPIFCGSLDYERVLIKEKVGLVWSLVNTVRKDDAGNPRAVSIDGTIYTFGVEDPGHRTLVHEMVHVWQYQNAGPIYKTNALHYQLADGDAAYHWWPVLNQALGWRDMGAEQQAGFVEAAFVLNETPGDANFWPEKERFLFTTPGNTTATDYTSSAQVMATQLVDGEGGPERL